jgi:hypothetical protein
MLFLVASLGCDRGSDSSNHVVPSQGLIVGTGTMVYETVEGGFYVIQSDDGIVYDPLGLPAEFKVDGLRVRFTLRWSQDAVSFHGLGYIVEIVALERLA